MENIITIDDKKYPKLLKQIGKDAPKKLYYRGEWPAPGGFDNCLAVVGSRRMTIYGKQVVQKLVSQIASQGITIVSGFMYGIDGEAHKAAIEAGGKTIAVLASGIDVICPDCHDVLYKQILESKGLIISEFEPGFLATNWSFPKRNRIVAGLCQAVMVVEAGEKSGSLITANFARKFGRKVLAVPGPLTSSLSKGIGQLIKKGAEVVTGAEDILKIFNAAPVGRQKKPEVGPRVDSFEERIIEELKREPMEIDFLARTFGLGANEIGSVVSLMQIKGLIKQENGKYYIKN